MAVPATRAHVEGNNALIKAVLSSQERSEAGDYQSLQEAGAAVAPRQLPVGEREEGGGEEVHRHRLGKRGPHRSRSGARSSMNIV